MDSPNEFYAERLPCGIHVVGQPMIGVESAAIGFLIGAGARDEESRDFGVSHTLEQMLFRGTESMDARTISESFDSLGISYDSSAGVEMTLVSAVLLGNRLHSALGLLLDCVRNSSFPADALDSVRSLQLQEIRQREDRPAQKVMDSLRRQSFRGNPIANDVLGTEETVSALSRDDIVRYWKRTFTPRNMVISVAGRFEWEPLLQRLQELTQGWVDGGKRSVGSPASFKSGVFVSHKESTQENIGFAFPAVPVADPRYYTASLIAQALGGSSHSRLFQEVREKRGLAYAVQARFDGFEHAGMMRIYVGTSAERAHESVEVVMDELGKLERDGLTEDELRLSKTRLKSQLVMRSESSLARMASNLRSWWFEEKLHNLSDISARIDAVSAADVGELLHQLGVTDHLAVVALGPRSEADLMGGVAATT